MGRIHEKRCIRHPYFCLLTFFCCSLALRHHLLSLGPSDPLECAGRQFVEGDVFTLDLGPEPYDFVFDRGMFHHVQVFHFEDYKNLVADHLVPSGYFHLICHHVSTRPTVLLDGLCGQVAKLLCFLTGMLVETGTGFTADELHEVFSDRFRFESTDLIWDDNNRPLCFASSLLQRIA